MGADGRTRQHGPGQARTEVRQTGPDVQGRTERTDVQNVNGQDRSRWNRSEQQRKWIGQGVRRDFPFFCRWLEERELAEGLELLVVVLWWRAGGEDDGDETDGVGLYCVDWVDRLSCRCCSVDILPL